MAARSLLNLAQYATVLAALAEGHDLARVLAHEGIDAAAWPDAAEAWSDQLAEAAGTDDNVLASFDEHLAAAQDRFGRRLAPLDEDLRAFLDFRRRWSLDADPPELLERLGLHATEVARLSRTWSNRIARDPALAAQERAILREEPGELPTVVPVAVELPPAPPAVVAAPPVPAADALPEEDLPAFAPISDEPGMDGPDDGRPDGSEASRLADVAPADRAGPARPQRPSFLITTAFGALFPKPALPFRAGAGASAGLAPQPAPGHPASLAATAALSVASFAPAVPFAARAAATNTDRNAPPEERAGTTAPMAAFVVPARFPFEPVEPMPERQAATPGEAPLSEGTPPRAARPHSETASFEGLSLAAVLPFTAPGGAGSELPGRGDIQHDTIELSALLAGPLPLASPPARRAGPTGTAPMPAFGAPPSSTSGAGDVAGSAQPASGEAAASLILEEYAAFCAELAAFPGEFAETFERYGLSSPQDGIDLASAWQERFRQAPDELETWRRLHRAHLELCRKQGRQEVKR